MTVRTSEARGIRLMNAEALNVASGKFAVQ
jgi:hypothetical protein